MVPLDPRWLSHAHVREMQAHEVVIESRPICCANQLSNTAPLARCPYRKIAGGVTTESMRIHASSMVASRVCHVSSDEMHEPQGERQDETDDQIAQQPPEQHERTVVRPPMFSGSFA